MLRRVIAPVMKNVTSLPNKGAPLAVMSRRYDSYDAKGHVPTTMDDLPVPNTSWETYDRARQAKYNMHLAVGVVFTAITLIVAKASGLVYLNYYPPPYPKDE